MATTGETRDTRIRLVTVHGSCTPELRKAIQKAATAEGLEVDWFGPTMTILTTK